MKTLQVALALACTSLYGQSVPFVGCPSSGQIEELEAPTGTSKLVAIGKPASQALAYYKSADGLTVLAPRGWHCQGASGSGGSALFLAPTPIFRDLSGWHGLDGPAIVVDYTSGENSGRYQVADILARVFPEHKPLAGQILESIDQPLPPGPYPEDALTRRSSTIVEYTTPAYTEGLGNLDSWIGKNELPITGAAILVSPPNSRSDIPDIVVVSVRLPRDLAWLAPTIIHYVERNHAEK